MSWCSSWGRVYFSNGCLFHGELVERAWFCSSLLSLILVDLVRCGLSPLFLVRCLVSNPAIPVVAMASGSMGSETRVFSCLFGFFVLKLLYACTYSTVAFHWFLQ